MEPVLRRLTEEDIADADRVNRLAFGTFFGMADPLQFRGDGDTIGGRLRMDPEGAFAAEIDGLLVGSGQLMNWGSVGILGPLTVHPDYQSRGIARAIMVPLMAELDRRGHDFVGLFTHPQSPLHIRLYESFGFWMERITGVMAKPVDAGRAGEAGEWSLLSRLSGAGREAAIAACRAVTETVYPGLDLEREIRGVVAHDLGEVLLLERGGTAVGFAVCHHGPGTEAGSGELRIKFGAVATGDEAPADFRRLVAACELLAADRGAPRLVAGSSSGRMGAYRTLQEAGLRTFMNGVSMLRPAEEGYNRPDRYVIDDWR